MTNLLNLIKSRRSIRKFQNKRIPLDVVKQILEAGRWAPSAHNLQPWKFVVVNNDIKINKIADLLEKKADALFSGFNIVMRDTAKKIRSSPFLLLIYNTGIISKKFSKLGSPYSEICNIFEIESVSNAIENMLLYIHSVGLGAAWYGMPLFCEKEINALLKQGDKLMALIAIGYPAHVKTMTTRKKLSEIAEFIS